MLFSAQNFSFASLTVCLLKKVANLLTSLLSHLHEGHWGSNFCCANPLTPTFLWTSSKKSGVITSGWSVSKFLVFGLVRLGEFWFQFGFKTENYFWLVNFGFRLTVSISRKKLTKSYIF